MKDSRQFQAKGIGNECRKVRMNREVRGRNGGGAHFIPIAGTVVEAVFPWMKKIKGIVGEVLRQSDLLICLCTHWSLADNAAVFDRAQYYKGGQEIEESVAFAHGIKLMKRNERSEKKPRRFKSGL